jgi:hypothetical protein
MTVRGFWWGVGVVVVTVAVGGLVIWLLTRYGGTKDSFQPEGVDPGPCDIRYCSCKFNNCMAASNNDDAYCKQQYEGCNQTCLGGCGNAREVCLTNGHNESDCQAKYQHCVDLCH